MTGIQPLSGLSIGAVAPDAELERAKPADFGGALQDAIASLVETQRGAESATMEFAAGRSDDVAATMLAIHKADLARQLALEVRNRIVDAYHEVLRMTV